MFVSLLAFRDGLGCDGEVYQNFNHEGLTLIRLQRTPSDKGWFAPPAGVAELEVSAEKNESRDGAISLPASA